MQTRFDDSLVSVSSLRFTLVEHSFDDIVVRHAAGCFAGDLKVSRVAAMATHAE